MSMKFGYIFTCLVFTWKLSVLSFAVLQCLCVVYIARVVFDTMATKPHTKRTRALPQLPPFDNVATCCPGMIGCQVDNPHRTLFLAEFASVCVWRGASSVAVRSTTTTTQTGKGQLVGKRFQDCVWRSTRPPFIYQPQSWPRDVLHSQSRVKQVAYPSIKVSR